jgi:DNA-directed RNA polymerase specialized sigma24 family protein
VLINEGQKKRLQYLTEAAQLGISLQTVKNIMSEALVDIRQHLTAK